MTTTTASAPAEVLDPAARSVAGLDLPRVVADADPVEPAVEDVLAVAVALHPGRDHLLGAVVAGRDVLAPARPAVPGSRHPVAGVLTVGVGVIHVVPPDHVRRMLPGRLDECAVQPERTAALLLADLVRVLEDLPLLRTRAATTRRRRSVRRLGGPRLGRLRRR